MKILLSAFCDRCLLEYEKEGKEYLAGSQPPVVTSEVNESGVY